MKARSFLFVLLTVSMFTIFGCKGKDKVNAEPVEVETVTEGVVDVETIDSEAAE